MSQVVGALGTIAFSAIVLSWILKSEKKCDCSQDWRRDYIKYFNIAVIVFMVMNLTARSFFREQIMGALNKPLFLKGLLGFATVYGLAALVNAGSILTYIPDLKKKGCDCAIEDDWRDNFIFWYMIISLVLASTMILFRLGAK
jgi:hypothetical protein